VTDLATLNGRPVDSVPVSLLRAMNYSHFSSMQVRGGRVRGLALHLDRLDRSSAELFGTGLDQDRVRGNLAGVVREVPDASIRVSVVSDLDVLIHATDPVEPGTTPPRLRSVEYERDLPHLKHNGTLGLSHQAREAERAGYDDALFTDRHGFVSEATIWNICCVTGDTVVWPSAPALPGIMMQLVQAGLRRNGVAFEYRPVPLAQIGRYDAAYLTNSIDPALPVRSIDAVTYADRPDLRAMLLAAYESNPWDEI
jgi:branched-subunit amino acid aminotransferase/4-amino-4-deoxychorismate lyase